MNPNDNTHYPTHEQVAVAAYYLAQEFYEKYSDDPQLGPTPTEIWLEAESRLLRKAIKSLAYSLYASRVSCPTTLHLEQQYMRDEMAQQDWLMAESILRREASYRSL